MKSNQRQSLLKLAFPLLPVAGMLWLGAGCASSADGQKGKNKQPKTTRTAVMRRLLLSPEETIALAQAAAANGAG